MELIENFKKFLLLQKPSPSAMTVKNYVADIRHFISWYESFFSKPFQPNEVTEETISQFKSEKATTYSVRSVERHISSLRKFFYTLKIQGTISHSPFDLMQQSSQTAPIDPWRLKEFKDFLYVYNASRLTIKNYIIDVKQFVQWIKKPTETTNHSLFSEKYSLSAISSSDLHSYKQNLIETGTFSATSINRKLSSLRKYLSWAHEQGYIHAKIAAPENVTTTQHLTSTESDALPEIAIKSYQKISKSVSPHENTPKIFIYSQFPPLRLFQKIAKGIDISVEALVVVPLTKAAILAHKQLWKLQGKKVFVTNSRFSSIITPSPLMPYVANIKKAIYAPHALSLKYIPWYGKALHHARYTRPNWYRKYHSYALAHYFNWAILIIFCTTIGFGMYNTFVTKPQQSSPTYASTAPPRILSFQGRLTDSNDLPISASTSLQFAIYTSATGGTALWQENDSVTPDKNGVFSVLLGNVTTIPQSLFANNQNLYLGITVGTTPELTPRQQLATVAFAANSETLQGMAPITQSGAGTTNVILALNSSGNLSVGASTTFQSTSGQFAIAGNTVALSTNSGSNGNITFTPDGTGVIDVQKPLVNSTLNGNFPSAPGAVEVDDLLAILASSSASALTINQTGTGALINASTSGNPIFTVGNTGVITSANYTVNGGIFYTNASGLFLQTGAGSLGECLTSNGGGAPSWGNCGGGTNFWNLDTTQGTLSPINGTVDVFFGGTSTSSANFAFINNAGGTPTASISGNITLNSAGTIQTTRNQSLTIGGTSTGNIILSPLNGSGNVTIAGLSAGVIHSSNAGVLSAAAVNLAGGATEVSGILPLANGGTNNNLTADNGGILYSDASKIQILAHSPTAGVCLISGGSAAPTWGSCTGGGGYNWWNMNQGTIYPVNTTLDFVLGGTSTSSANFAFINNAGGTPTASISGNITLNSAGTIQTTRNQSLTIGGTSTGNIILSPIGGSGTVTLNGTVNSSLTPTVTDTYNLGTPSLEWNNVYVKNLFASGTYSGFFQRNLGVIAPLNTTDDFAVGGTATSTAKFQISGITGNATTTGNLTFNGNGTIQSTNNQPLTLGGVTTGGIILSPNNGTGTVTLNGTVASSLIPSSTNTYNLGSLSSQWNNIYGNNFYENGQPLIAAWQRNLGVLSPLNITDDLAIGGTATSTAKFQVFGNTGNATMGALLTLNGVGSLQTTSDQGLTIGGTTTGNITLSPLGGAGTVTISGLGTGVVQSTGGVLSTSAVALGTEVSGTLPIGNGGTNTTSIGSAGSVAYSNGSAYAFTGIGSTGDCLVSNGSGAPTWGSCSAAAGATNYWTQDNGNGILYPNNPTLDILFGGTSTASAKFAFINDAGGTPTASIAGNLTLNSAGVIQTTNNQPLTLGGNSTGNIILSPNNGSGIVTINGTKLITTASSFDLLNTTATTINFGGAATTLSIGAATGTTTVNNGLTVTGIATLNGNISLGSSTANTITATGRFTSALVPNQTNTYDLGTPALEWNNLYVNNIISGGSISGFWQRLQGVLSPFNITDDFAVGGTSTSSAKFQVFGNTGNATTAGTLTFNGTGNLIQTTNNQGLTIGGNTTGNITLSPLTGSGTVTVNGTKLVTTASSFDLVNTTASTINFGGAGTSIFIGAATGTTTVNNALSVNGAFSANNNVTLGNNSGNSINPVGQFSGSLIPQSTSINLGSVSNNFGTLYAQNVILPSGGGYGGYWQLFSGALSPTNSTNDVLVGGTATSSAKFQVFGTTGNATTAGNLTFNGNGTIQTTNNQSLTLGGTSTGNIILSPNNGNGILTINGTINSNLVPTANDTYNLGSNTLEWNNLYVRNIISGGNISGFWQRFLGVLSPANITDDFAVGGTSTSSAKFQVFGLTGNATSAGSFTFNTNGLIQTTNNQPLTLGGNTTGPVQLSPEGTTGLYVDGTGNVGINTTAPSEKLSVNGNATVSGNLTFTSSASIQTTSNLPLTLGGTTTGGITLSPNNGSGIVTINGTKLVTTASSFDLLNTTATTINFGGAATTANLVTNATTLHLADAASSNTLSIGGSAGTTTINNALTATGAFTANNTATLNGNITLGATTSNTINATGEFVSSLIPHATDTYDLGTPNLEWNNLYVKNLISGGTISGFFQRNLGVIAPLNITDDFALGGTATSSAKFQVSGTTGNATSAGNLTFSTAGSIQTTSNLPLTLGGSTTGGITLSPNNGSGAVTVNGNTLTTTATSFDLLNTTATTINFGGAATTANLVTNATTLHLADAAASNTLSIGGSAGTTTVNNALTVTGVFTANNNVVLGATTANTITPNGLFATSLLPQATTVNLGGTSNYFGNAYITNVLTSASSVYQGFWQRFAGVVSPVNLTDDLALGGTATGSAKFQVSGTTGNATTAGTLTFSTAGSIQTTSNLPLTLGGSTTGGITLSPNNGNGTVTVNGTINSNLVPTTTDTYNLGSNSLEWNNLYVKNIISGGNISGFWQRFAGVVSPVNITDDLALGGTATSSAKFQVFGTTGNATTAGTLTFNAAGLIQTTNMNPLTLGSASTGPVQLSPKGTTGLYVDGTGNVGINTTAPSEKLSVNGNATVSGNLTFTSSASIQTTSNQSLTIGGSSTGNITLSPLGGGAGSTLNVNAANVSTNQTSLNLFNTTATTINFGGAATTLNIGASSGTTTVNNALTVTGALTANSTANLNGNVTLGSSTSNTINATGEFVSSLIPHATDTYDLGTPNLEWNNLYVKNIISGGNISGFWQRFAGVVSPVNITDDLALGGTATSSAKFQVFGTTGNATTAGTLTFNTTGSIQTTNMLPLTIGGTTTGGITLSPNNGSGIVTIKGLSTGILHSTSGVLSSSLVSLTADITGTLPIGNGGTNTTSIGSAGSVAYSNGSAYAFTGIGSTGDCLVSNGSGAPTWGSCSAAAGATNYWTQDNGNGILYPNNPTLDILFGGTSTASAKFAFINDAGGTPTASIAGNLTLNSAGVIQTTNNQPLTLGGTSTGNIILSPNNGSGILTINGTINSNLVPTTTDTYNLGSNSLEWNNLYAKNIISTGNISGFFQRFAGVVSPTNITDDLAIGGTATSSAKFQVFGTTGNATTAGNLTFNGNDSIQTTNNQPLTIGGTTTGGVTLSANNGAGTVSLAAATVALTGTNPILTTSSNNALSLLAGTGTITLGTNSTGGNLQFFNATNTLTNAGNLTIAGTATVNGTGASKIAGTLGIGVTPLTATGLDVEKNSLGNAAAIFANLNTVGDLLTASNSAGTKFVVTNAGNISLPSGASIDSLTASGTINLGSGANTSTVVLGKSGGTVQAANLTTNGVVFVSGGNGTLNSEAQLATSRGGLGANVTAAGAGEILYSTSATAYGHLAAAGSVGQCLTSGGAGAPSWATCATGSAGTNWWQVNNGSLFPINNTLDMFVGGSATTSAKFAVLNINNGTPVASVSSGLNGTAIYLTADGSLQTATANTLTIGGSKTGNIALTPQNGSGSVTINGTSLDGNAGGFTLLSTPTSVTFASAATSMTIGATSGTVTFRNPTIDDNASTATLFGTPTTLTFGGAATTMTLGASATTLSIGNASGTTTVQGAINVKGNTTLGTGTSNTVVLNGLVTGAGANNAVQPGGTSGSTDLGSPSHYWGTVYANNFIAPVSGGTSGFWQLASSVLAPVNAWNDLAVGGTATGSATPWQVFATTLGANTAGTATSSGGLSFRGATTNVNLLNGSILKVNTSVGGDSGLTTELQLNNNGDITFGGANINTTAASVNLLNATTTTINFAGAATTLNIGNASGNTALKGNLTLGSSNSNTINPAGLFSASLIPNATSVNLGSSINNYGSVFAQNLFLSGNIGGFWQQFNNVISPTTVTNDLAIGGTGTSSAKFQIFGTTGNATTAGTLTFNAAGLLQTTNMNPFTIGSASTGPIQLSPKGTTGLYIDGSGNVAINSTSPLARLDVNGTASVSSTLTFRTGGATIQASSNNVLTLGGNTTGAISFGSNVNSNIIPSATDAFNLGSDPNSGGFEWNTLYVRQIISPSGGGTAGYWQLSTGGVLAPANITNDLAVGGNATSSAVFQVFAKSFTNDYGTIAAGSASTSGQLTFRGSSQIDMLNGGNLSFYTSVGGDKGITTSTPAFYLANSKTVGFGTNTPQGVFDVASQGSTYPSDLTLGQSAGTNLILNPSFENNSSKTTDWTLSATAQLGTNTVATESALFGANALKYNNITPSGTYTATSSCMAVTSGSTYTASAYIFRVSGFSGNAGIDVQTFTGTGCTGTQATAGRINATTTGQWTRLTTSVSTSGIVSVEVRFITDGTNTNSRAYADGFQLEQGSSATPYMDGSLGPGYYWTGQPNNSSSTRQAGSVFAYGELNSANGIGAASNGTFPTLQLDQDGLGDIITASASGSTQLRLTNGGTLYSRAFYDLDNTSYFLDPAASTTSLAVAGNALIGPSASASARLRVMGTDTNGTDTIQITDSLQSGYGFMAYHSTGVTTPYLNLGSWNGMTSSFANVVIPGGNLGIGTTGPTNNLTVAGDYNGTTDGWPADAGTGQIVIKGASNPNLALGIGVDTTNSRVRIQGQVIGTGAMAIGIQPQGGNVGIGTTTPDEILQVNGLAHIGTNQGSMTSPTTSNTNLVLYNISSSNWSGIGSDGGGAMYFATGTGGVASNMVIDPTGNVGIGYTSMGAKLDVAGNVGINATSPIANSGLSIIDQNTTGNLGTPNGMIALHAGGALSTSLIIGYDYTAGANQWYIRTGSTNVNVGFSQTGGALAGYLDQNNHWNMSFTNSSTSLMCKSATGTGIRYATECATGFGAGDYTENVVSSSVEAGDVVEADPNAPDQSTLDVGKQVVYVTKTAIPYNQGALGVISQWGMTLDRYPDPNIPASDWQILSIAGVMPVKVSTMNGPIHKGDPITSSVVPGLGMVATKAGPIVGKATENFNPSVATQAARLVNGSWQVTSGACQTGESNCYNEGKVLALLNVSWYDPDVYLTSTGDYQIASATPSADFTVPTYYTLTDALGTSITRMGAFLELAVGNLRAGSIQAQQTITNSLAVATTNVSIAGQSLHDYILSVVQGAGLTGSTTVASSSAIQTNVISPLSGGSVALRLTNSGIEVAKDASSSAVAGIDNQGNATFSGSLTSQNLAVNTDATISGTLHAHRIEADEIAGLQAVVGTLSAQNITNVTNIYFATPSGSVAGASTNIGSNTISSTSSGSLTPFLGYTDIASYSGFLAYVPNLSAATASFSQNLTATGTTSLSDTTVNGQLAIGTQLILADNAVNVLGSTLQLQSLQQGNVSFEGGLVAIDTNGNLTVDGNAVFAKNLAANVITPLANNRDLTFKLGDNNAASGSALATATLNVQNASGSGIFNIDQLGNVIASGAASIGKLNFNAVQPALAVSNTEVVATGSAGTATVKANQTEVTIDNPMVTAKSLIYITPVGQTNYTPYLLRQVSGSSFTVGIPVQQYTDTTFNWLIVN